MSNQTIARGAAQCQHPEDEPLIWKFNKGNPCYLCPRCRAILAYDPVGSSAVTLRQLKDAGRVVVSDAGRA